MPSSTSVPVRKFGQIRALPGLLLFNVKGQLIGANPSAERLLPNQHRTHIVRSIRSWLRSHQVLTQWPKEIASYPAGPILQSTFKSGARRYGLQAFWLNRQPQDQAPLVGILVERTTQSRASRLGLARAQRRFRLSPREINVIQALQTGMSDKEIAVSLGIGFETVRDYLKNIRNKLGVSTRTAIISTLLSA